MINTCVKAFLYKESKYICSTKFSSHQIVNMFHEVEIAKQTGKTKYIQKRNESVWVKSLSTIHRYKILLYQILCTYDQICPIECGGIGVICDADCGQLGKVRKKGYTAGLETYNKAWFSAIIERGGVCRFDVFAHPGHGSERKSEIEPFWDEGLRNGSLVCVDTAMAYKSYILDNLDRNISILRINHSEVGPRGTGHEKIPGKGFSWVGHLTNEYPGLSYLDDNQYRLIHVHTCYGDGYIGNIKTEARKQRGITRSTVKGFLKLEQLLLNCRRLGLDPWVELLRRFGVVMISMRDSDSDVSMDTLKNSLHWNWELYGSEDELEEDIHIDSDSEEEEEETQEMWQCPGCDKIIQKRSRSNHKNTCRYYNGASDLIIEHSSTHCHCCVVNYFHNTYEKSHFKLALMEHENGTKRKRKKSQKKSRKLKK